MDAEYAAEAIHADQHELPPVQRAEPGGVGLKQLLQNRGVKVIGFGDWQMIDAKEQQQGADVGKPREKLIRIADMLTVAQQSC